MPSTAQRPPTPSRSTTPYALPPMPKEELPDSNASPEQVPRRRSSFSFLKRSKSVERMNSKRSVSGGKKLTKKQLKEMEIQKQREAAMIPQQPPKLPDVVSTPQLQTFGGEGGRGDGLTTPSNRMGMIGPKGGPSPLNFSELRTSPGPYSVPIPPIPGSGKGTFVDPYARTESMTHRGRYSYASSAVSTLNSPRRIRRRKDPTPFNVLVIGARNSGKSAFVDFLRHSLALPARKVRQARDDFAPETGPSAFNRNFVSQYLESEMDDGERMGITLWDSEGFEKNLVDLQLREITGFVESKFEETLDEEMKVVRSPGARDTHIHCVFLLLDPVRLDANISATQKAREAREAIASGANFTNGSSFIEPPSPDESGGVLDQDLDIQVLQALQGKTTVIPVLSKADTITSEHMLTLKRAVWDSLKTASLDPMEALGLEDIDAEEYSSDEDEEEEQPRTFMRATPRHDSKNFDERDEDTHRLRGSDSNLPEREDRSTTSHLDFSSSSSSSSVLHAANTQQVGSSTYLAPPGPGHDNTVRGSSRGRNAAPSSTTIPPLPLSILSPSRNGPHEPRIGSVGRHFPWGSADPYDPDHCDFVKLKQAVFGEWRTELREASRELWYEKWRTSRLNSSKHFSETPSTRTAKKFNAVSSQNQYQSGNGRPPIPGGMPGGMHPIQGAQSWPLPSR